MPASIVSTQEVATMLNVTETTIKRWADEEVLPCVRTPGGHRKFRLNDIVRFAENKGFTIAGGTPPAMTDQQIERLQLGIHTKNNSLIADVFREEALQADREGILALLIFIYKHHIPFPVIMDEVVRPAFEVIGAMWEKGTLEVHREHAASQATLEAIVQISTDVHRKKSNGMTAVCACLDGELHELGIRGLAYSLQCEGWMVHLLGGNTPAETLGSFVRTTRPQLLCISVTIGLRRAEMREKLDTLADQVHSYSGQLIVGGINSASLAGKNIRFDHHALSVQDAIAFTRDAFILKPGPKKKHWGKQKVHH